MQVGDAAAGALLGRRREKDFALGFGEGDGALVAALGDRVALTAKVALPLDQPPPDLNVIGRVANRGGHFRRADRGGNVLAVQQHL